MLIQNFIKFLEQSPTNYHACKILSDQLIKHKFTELKESKPWKLKQGGRYFICRNGTSICAFIVPNKKLHAFLITASHTDSPALKLKPNPEFYQDNMVLWKTDVYGGPLCNAWLNRELSLSGSVYLQQNKSVIQKLVFIKEYPVIIPQLAIHLDSEIKQNGLKLNQQQHLIALASTFTKKPTRALFKQWIQKHLKTKAPLLCHDLFLVPIEAPSLSGGDTLLSAYRLDNLQSLHASFSALLQQKKAHEHNVSMFIAWDNEETGSRTPQGAASPFLKHLMKRICNALTGSEESFYCSLDKSLCLSIDMAHAFHPSYAEKFEDSHKIFLNQGPAIKWHSQQNYLTDPYHVAKLRLLLKTHNIPIQDFAMRNDLPCGSTIGPINGSICGIKTIDLGCAQHSMHSTRELMGTQDHHWLCQLLQKSYEHSDLILG